ncbi:MAG: tetratricopeptide repeat protein [Gemmatimonadota bacterium]
MRARWLPLAAALAAACATPGQVQRVETAVSALRSESARRDSLRSRQLADLIALERQIQDSLAAVQRAFAAFRGQTDADLYSVRQQLVQLQELVGQSQRRLTELRTQLEARAEGMAIAVATPEQAGAGDQPGAGTPSAEQMYETSLAQLRRGSPGTARAGFRELLRAWPTSPLVPDATYFLAETFAVDAPDSAAVLYAEVVEKYPASSRAPTALYKLGLLAERRQDSAAARQTYERVVQRYPSSDEAALAREKLKAPR